MAEAGETVWARAKDATKLYAAIEAKLRNQAAYAVWRQDVAIQGRPRKDHSSENNLPDTDPGAMVVHRWRTRLCASDADKRWIIDEKKLTTALADAEKRCVRICEQENLGTIRGTEGTGEFERYTPAPYIEAARSVLGTIDLDPATSDYAQHTVRAGAYFTPDDDGLTRDWFGNVWLNPPYHRELAPRFIDKLVSEVTSGRVTEAVMLTNNATDTAWFKTAADICTAICFTTGRISFEVPNSEPVLPTQGQAFFYFGRNIEIFLKVFGTIGICVQPIARQMDTPTLRRRPLSNGA